MVGGVLCYELLVVVGVCVCSWVCGIDLVVQIGDCFGVYFDGDVVLYMDVIYEWLRLVLLEEFGFGDVSLRIYLWFGVVMYFGMVISGIDLVGVVVFGIDG